MSEFLILPGALTKLPGSSNFGPSLTAFQILKYTKDDLQWIFKIVTEAKPPIACDQDYDF